MENVIKVGMADMNVAISPGILTTLGLGSCVGIVLFDPVSKVGGMAHIMLPSSIQAKNNSNLAKFADTAIVKLIEDMMRLGAVKHRLIAKLAGGAQMFAFTHANEMMRIGCRNVEAAKEVLQKLNINVVAEDTGGNYGRTIEFFTESGSLFIKTIGCGMKQI